MLFTVFAMGCLLLQELGFDSIVDSRCGNQHLEVAEEKLADLVVREASFPKLYAVRSTFSRTMFGVNRAIEIQGKQILFVDKAKDIRRVRLEGEYVSGDIAEAFVQEGFENHNKFFERIFDKQFGLKSVWYEVSGRNMLGNSTGTRFHYFEPKNVWVLSPLSSSKSWDTDGLDVFADKDCQFSKVLKNGRLRGVYATEKTKKANPVLEVEWDLNNFPAKLIFHTAIKGDFDRKVCIENATNRRKSNRSSENVCNWGRDDGLDIAFVKKFVSTYHTYTEDIDFVIENDWLFDSDLLIPFSVLSTETESRPLSDLPFRSSRGKD